MRKDIVMSGKGDLIYRQDAIDALGEKPLWAETEYELGLQDQWQSDVNTLKELPSTPPDGYVKIPETGIGDLSDGYHTFNQLYYQRMMLFATIVKQNKERAWKSLRHEDGELCFGGGWFIVGIDTPVGSYTYHYEDNYYSLFDCKELERSKHWDGHTEKDVTRLLSLTAVYPKVPVTCRDCKYSDEFEGDVWFCRRLNGPFRTSAESTCNKGKRK